MIDFEISFDSSQKMRILIGAGWSSLVARRAHNPKVVGSNPAPATRFIIKASSINLLGAFLFLHSTYVLFLGFVYDLAQQNLALAKQPLQYIQQHNS